MKRASLKEKFTGEPTMGEVIGSDQDEVEIEVQGGRVVLAVPSAIPDEEVFKEEYFQKFVRLELKLETGKTLHLWISEGATGIDVRFE